MTRFVIAIVLVSSLPSLIFGQEPENDLQKLAEEVARLREENLQLRETIAQMQKQLDAADLSTDPATPSLKMRQVLGAATNDPVTSVPVITLRSKVVDQNNAIAVLDFGSTTLWVRPDMEVLVPVGEGQATPMKVMKIDASVVQLEFSALNQTVMIYD